MRHLGTAEGKPVQRPDFHSVAFMTLYARIIYELGVNHCISQETLARHLDVTMRTVQRHLNELEREGYVKVRRDRKPYTYEVAWERTLPYFEALTVGMFRPESLHALAQHNRNS
ncbi:MAG: hypothetical protein PVSMB7_18780 [Chloroflexota bacterium]